MMFNISAIIWAIIMFIIICYNALDVFVLNKDKYAKIDKIFLCQLYTIVLIIVILIIIITLWNC